MRSSATLLLVLALAASGCNGVISDAMAGGGGGSGAGSRTGDPLPAGLDVAQIPSSLARRLTRAEIDNVLRDLLGDDTRAASALLPEDSFDPFDNDYTAQRPSAVLLEGLETVGQQSVRRALSDAEMRSRLVPCEPAGPGDAACLRRFVETFGRRAFRRPLEEAEIADFMSLQPLAVEANDFWYGVEIVARAILLVPDFLYRIELGTPVRGEENVRRLNDYEIATRMSFLLWGTTPDDWLLDLAAGGELSAPDTRASVAAMMLDDPRAVQQVDRFHAMWLGYDKLPHSADLVTAMREETTALLRRVIFDRDAPYMDVFRAEETFVSPMLADHYGLTHPGGESPAWVSYDGTPRRGLLSHGTVLSAFSKWNDTSPTQRGIFIRERLLCQTIPPPPPTVNADDPPQSAESACKYDRYAAHRNDPGCAGCHSLTDPVGFGLERFDRQGRYRETDDGLPECAISGEGELVGVGTFNGPAELSELMIGSGELEACAVRQLYRFAIGRRERAEDEPSIEALVASRRGGEWTFRDLLAEVVASDAFALVRVDDASTTTTTSGE